MDFRPNKKKVIVSVVVVILILLYVFSTWTLMPVCKPCTNLPECVSYDHLSPIQRCECRTTCKSLGYVLFEWFIYVLFPGILLYVIWSFFEKKGNEDNSKKRIGKGVRKNIK